MTERVRKKFVHNSRTVKKKNPNQHEPVDPNDKFFFRTPSPGVLPPPSPKFRLTANFTIKKNTLRLLSLSSSI
jgi:hypothetical protein